MTLPTPISSHIGIRASAGSGKTYSLTTAYLKLFFTGARTESMLATTFTRTAAAEILARVMQRMAKAVTNPDALAQLADDVGDEGLTRGDVLAHLIRFCRTLDRVNIGTIDSFFSKIAQSYRYESGLSAGGSVVDENSGTVKRLRLQALDLLLKSPDARAAWELLNLKNFGKAARSVINPLDTTLSEWLAIYRNADSAEWSVAINYEPLSDEELERALNCLEGLEGECVGKQYEVVLTDLSAMRNGDWKSLFSKGIFKVVFNKVNKYGSKAIPDAVIAAYSPIVKHAIASIIQQHNQKTLATRDLLESLGGHFDGLLRSKGVGFYSDVPLALSRLTGLDNFSEMSHRLDADIAHLMFDEFQDTDPRQWSILSIFANQTHNRASSVLWVGDPKQSIYGWRGAKPEIFLGLDRQYPALVWRDQDTSYRSSQVVLDVVNRVFQILGENNAFKSEFQSAAKQWCAIYNEHAPARDLPGHVRMIETPASDTESVDESDDTAGQASSHTDYCADEIESMYRQYPGKSIAVLTRSGKVSNTILYELRRRGVPATGLAGTPLLSDPAVALVVSVLQLADHPGDSASAFRVLHSPLARAISLNSLSRLHLSDVSFALRRTLTENGYGAVLTAWAQLILPQCNATGATNIAALLNLANRFDVNPGLRPRDFVDLVSDSVSESYATGAVKVMTIHKAKGLEYDIVVLPEVDTSMTRTPNVLFGWHPETHHVAQITRYPDKTLREAHPVLQELGEANLAVEYREALSLLYVALTRARHGLVILTAPPGKKSDNALSAVLRNQLTGQAPVPYRNGGTVLFESGNVDWNQNLPANPTTFVPNIDDGVVSGGFTMSAEDLSVVANLGFQRRRRHAPPSELDDDTSVSVDALLGRQGRTGKAFGIEIHALFERIEWLPDESGVERALAAEATRRMSGDARSAFEAMLEKEAVRRAFARPRLDAGETADLWIERRFATIVHGEYVSGTFDRVVVIRRDGIPVRATVLDIKTTGLHDGEPVDLAEKYRPQMTVYHGALRTMLGLAASAVRCVVLFPLADVLVEIGVR